MLPSAWVENLFGRLTVRYGAAFMRQYEGLDVAIVKADWADVLDGVRGESIAYALRYLPNTPPNALQFRDVCRRAPEPTVKRLRGPDEPPERRAEAIALVRSALKRDNDNDSAAAQCIRNIERIVAMRGGRISIPQRLQLEACRRMLWNAPSDMEATEEAKRRTQERVDAFVEASAA